MDWSNEEYVRLYTRETAADLELSWEALALWRALLVKFDRAGVISIKNGWASVARLVRMPFDIVQQTGPELIRDGRVRMIDGALHAPNFTEAQTASKSDKVRQRESRERRRERASAAVQVQDSTVPGHAVSQAVTPGHDRSQNVTLCSADPKPIPLLIPPDEPAVKPSRILKHALPDDWSPDRSEANLTAEATARSRGIDLDQQLASLRDWARGNNAKKVDWNATWRNWTRNAKPPSGAYGTPVLPFRKSEAL